MSLFPAYAADASTTESIEIDRPSHWLENESFEASTTQLKAATNQDIQIIDISNSTSNSSPSNSNSESDSSSSKTTKKLMRKRKKRKEGKKQKINEKELPSLEFNGDEEYFIDKKPALSYKTVKTLHKPACPRYHLTFKRCLTDNEATNLYYIKDKFKKTKRYYKECKYLNVLDSSLKKHGLDENEYTLRLGQLNRKVLESPTELQHWLDLINLQNENPYKWSRLLLAEKKLDIMRRAMVYHQRNDILYRIFIDTINDTYPSFEVTKLLDGLLSKDAYSYTLWTAQIMTTQGSMARCIVPDVLRIYERCMQKMYHAQKQTLNVNVNSTFDTDMIMLRLFNNCALFLRQAGLYENFFALIKLALELNISTFEFSDLKPSDDDQKTLIEYEELILQSGLPMNEIWLRIEKLRQCFNFLPCPANSHCNDPQRIVFNEDVCAYIYPLKNMDKSFYLMLIILRLLKLPFVQCDGLAAKFSSTRVDGIGDTDAIEEALTVGIRTTYATRHEEDQFEFFSSLYELSKEMVVTPTYLSCSIGNEIYIKCITSLLLKASAAYAGIDERRRIIFLLLFCRFERLLLVLEKAARKLTPQFVKSGRGRFKKILKESINRNCLPLYTEFAIYEYEALEKEDDFENVQKTFEHIIENMTEDLANTYLTYAEILLKIGKSEMALQILTSYVLKIDLKQKNTISIAKKLAALKQISEKVDNLISIERNVEFMVLEQYLLTDQTVTLLKIRCLLQYLIGQKIETLNFLEKVLNIFRCATERHQFLRERMFELYINIAQLPDKNCFVSNAALSFKLFEAIKLYPRNLYFLQICGTLYLPWYRIRKAILSTNPNIMSVIFLIAAARFRFLNVLKQKSTLDMLQPSIAVAENEQKYNEIIVRNRILHIFRMLTENDAKTDNDGDSYQYNKLRRNALFWRLYLRCLSDQSTAFETSKKCLLTALDDCPWDKSLYMDGATYVPQELSHLQDLMIEKQLRVYALPQELEILRER